MNRFQRWGWNVRAKAEDWQRATKKRIRQMRGQTVPHYTIEIEKVRHDHSARTRQAARRRKEKNG